MMQQTTDELLAEIENLRARLGEAEDTLEAIRTGQVDALVVQGSDGHALFTLRTADHSYRMFIEQMTEGAITLSASGLIVYSNSQFSSMVGEPLSNVIGRQFSDFIAPSHQPVFDELFKKGWFENVKGELLVKKGDTVVSTLLSLNRLQLEDEVAISVIVTDLTAQKETERQLLLKNQQLELLNQALIDSNHDLQQFASVASHDLQEPLRKILIFSNFLKEQSFNDLPGSSRQYLEKIISSASRMKVLIIDILNYSRLSSGDDLTEEVSLTALVNEIVDDFDLWISERQARVEIHPLPVVEGNRGQLRQVFYNLINNALKFTSPDKPPHVVISCTPVDPDTQGGLPPQESAHCSIRVKDNGIGFDDQFATSIFNLFEKLNPKSTFEGSGIGLAIAKKIIDKHHGLIVAQSTPGEGAEFSIVLPYKRQ